MEGSELKSRGGHTHPMGNEESDQSCEDTLIHRREKNPGGTVGSSGHGLSWFLVDSGSKHGMRSNAHLVVEQLSSPTQLPDPRREIYQQQGSFESRKSKSLFACAKPKSTATESSPVFLRSSLKHLHRSKKSRSSIVSTGSIHSASTSDSPRYNGT